MISIPILRWTLGDGVLSVGVTLGVLLQCAAVLVSLGQSRGTWEVMRTLALVSPLAWLVEYVGSTTGFPFGVYHYTALLQPQLGGVPLLVPLAWLMMLPPAWVVAALIMKGAPPLHPFIPASSSLVSLSPRHPVTLPLCHALLSAAAFTAWDLFLDPQMVAWGYWVWADPPAGWRGYFGIPWTNYLGWYLCSALITLLVCHSWLAPKKPAEKAAWLTMLCTTQPAPRTVDLLLFIYTITWLLQGIGQLLFWEMPGPALAGFAVMGFFVVGAWHNFGNWQQ